MRAERSETWLDRTEIPLLLLAAVAVGLYLAELLGLDSEMATLLARVLDVVFVLDLVVKSALLRGPYLRSPWFLIDFISALPALALLQSIPSVARSLRFVRAFRVFRILRTLRVLRALRVLRGVRLAETDEERRGTRFDLALSLGVITYTALFLGLVQWVHATSAEPARAEFFLVLGSTLGMLLVLGLMRVHVPEVAETQVRQLLNVALPRQVANHFLKHPERYDETHAMPASVIFCDVRGFTATVEELHGDLETLKSHLENAIDAIVGAHMKHDLIVDKFIGDAVMSFRGGPLVSGDPVEHARRCVQAALDTVDSVKHLPYFCEVKVGGATMERGLIGTFGTSQRLSYTILGDRVNLAARLESSCNKLGVNVLFCNRTRAMVANEVTWRCVGLLRVRGKADPEPVHEPLRGRASWLDAWETGRDAWMQGDAAAATTAFEAVIASRGSDGPSQIYLDAMADGHVPADRTLPV
ncbi:MAG: adenylate/guanylate cyclase domain-containing protein [Proteobacteria bacterium]|nr:adenylate/guanylate cyclase domain-containing protein [Pseudomonadota bacterium]